MEVSEVRRRLRAAFEEARKAAAERRERTDAARRAYEEFLEQRAVPVFHKFAAALTGEGRVPFSKNLPPPRRGGGPSLRVSPPPPGGRPAPGRRQEKSIAPARDAGGAPPAVIGRTSRGRGRRMISSERPVRDRTAIAD